MLDRRVLLYYSILDADLDTDYLVAIECPIHVDFREGVKPAENPAPQSTSEINCGKFLTSNVTT